MNERWRLFVQAEFAKKIVNVKRICETKKRIQSEIAKKVYSKWIRDKDSLFILNSLNRLSIHSEEIVKTEWNNEIDSAVKVNSRKR